MFGAELGGVLGTYAGEMIVLGVCFGGFWHVATWTLTRAVAFIAEALTVGRD